MGNNSSLKMFPIDQGVTKSLEEEVQRLAIQDFDGSVNRIYRNPFLIVEIIENIFPYMDFESQLASRLVCKLWNQISTPILQPNCHIHFQRLETDYASVFSHQLEDTSKFPISKVTLVLPLKGPSTAATTFFTNHGKDIHELVLSPCKTSDCKMYTGFLNSILEQFCPNLKHLTLMKLHYMSFRDISFSGSILPNLESLKVEVVETYMYSNPYHALHFLKDLIKRAPKLEKLSTDFKYSKHLFVRFYKYLKETGINTNLLELDLQYSRLADTHLDLLNEIGFPQLKVLRVDSLLANTVGDRFEHFLKVLSPSLEKLVLDGDVGNQKLYFKIQERNDAGLKITFPLMKKLKVFENRNVEGFQVGSIEFLKRFPNVEELFLEDFGVWAVCKAAPWRDLFPYRIDSEAFSSVGFKKVRKLNMKTIFRPYKNNILSLKRMVSYIPMLETFQTSVSLHSDCTGFGEFLSVLSTSSVLSRLTLLLRDCEMLFNPTAARNFEDAIKTYLPQFKKLQKLELQVVDLPSGSKFRLSRGAVNEGLCKIENLTALTLIGFEFGSTHEYEIEQNLWKKLTYLEVKDVDNSEF